ncbi:hypothetical protein SAMN05421780_11366 [Flexibacter flexilis DSM 6793]|uniref:Uncharacterized protein n=1 Tax=Flexibacter flexilis DSM 6793 TaxID=927664 RepID=A0A1I1N9V9_9BACT|nr:hypothetical protein [Flexibacter flexilis]SFC94461.1 hypothetical protein SAMN05421780_11366 [Flexibacter flexilis DSM 6793]
MSNLDFSKIASKVLTQQLETQIKEYKVFYKTHLRNVKDRQLVLSQLDNLCIRFQKISQKIDFLSDPERYKLEEETEKLLKKYFNNDIFELYNKKIPTPEAKRKIPNPENKFWLTVLDSVYQAVEVTAEQVKQELVYKTDFVTFLNNCLLYFGLHPNILKRDNTIYKRYNCVLEHHFKSPKIKQTESKILLKKEILQAEFLTPYEKKLPIRINGKLIPFEDIYQIKITSTILQDDEIELFAAKNKFTWTDNSKDYVAFINNCHDETEQLHNNPYLIGQDKERFRNHNTFFVHPTRILELQKIKNNKFDLIKLIQLCEELNNASSSKNPFSLTFLARAIIDHTPPIFGFSNFSEVANNYSGGTRSFKKSMQNLDNSLRNIADNNIHSQVRKKEVLPTTTQVDFTQELDLLLSEIVRILE